MREELANLCHEQWSNWVRYMFSKGTFNEDDSWTMPGDLVKRWMRQMNTSYIGLLEVEQESDRREADKFIKVMELHNG